MEVFVNKMEESQMKTNKINKLTMILVTLLMTCGAAQIATAKSVEATANSYDVLTHIIVGSNEPASGKMIDKRIDQAMNTVKNDFDFANYSVEASHFQSLGNGGNISFQSMLRRLGSLAATDNPIFSEWHYGGFYTDKASADSVGFKSFRFQARVPVKYRGIENQSNSTTFVKYEFLKLALNNVELEVGKPRAIASLPMPENGESLFFVLEVRMGGRQ